MPTINTTANSKYNWGEPILNSDFLEILEIAIRYGFKIGISSNAVVFARSRGIEVRHKDPADNEIGRAHV